MNILVACEESQAITKELRLLGHQAYSCDLLECSGGHPEWHFNIDVFEVIENKGGTLQNGKKVKIKNNWDIMIAHPPCTYLAVSGAKWYYHPDDKHLPIVKYLVEKGINFSGIDMIGEYLTEINITLSFDPS